MNLKKRSDIWTGVIISSILLTVPYIVPHTGLLMLFALLPLLEAERLITERGVKRGWIFHYSAFLLWNFFTTYWIYNATLPGAIAAIVLNSLQMSLIFGGFRWFKRKVSPSVGYLFLVFGWLAWEHFYFEAEISWPWLVLGNGFATSIKNIQWYEYTGTLGGSLWVLVANVLLFRFLSVKLSSKFLSFKLSGNNIENGFNFQLVASRLKTKGTLLALILCVILLTGPVVASQIMYYTYKENHNPKEFLIIQPNIDPYSDKFSGMSQDEQDEILIKIASEGAAEGTAMIVAPETFTSNLLENDPLRSGTVPKFIRLLKTTGVPDILFGAQTFRVYPSYDHTGPPTLTARKTDGGWYDSFNTAVYLDSTGRIDYYHKSKLVVGVEYLPYPQYLGFLGDIMIDLGGATGSYGTQDERYIRENSDGTIKIGAAICYESVYGDYYRGYILKGANVMSIITNDGWWGNTPGYRQHLRYASLRAIETRRSIVRSANTGISAFINQRGDIISQLGWWERGCLRGEVNLNEKETLFVRYGDYTGRIAYVSMLMFASLALLTLLGISLKGRG